MQEIIDAANRKIDQMCDTDIIATRAKLNELYSAFEKMGEEFSNMFSGVNPEELHNMIGALGNSGVNEEKIVSAYLEHMKKSSNRDADDK